MPDCGCNHFPAAGGNVTFDPGVNVGIGTTSPATMFHVASTASYPTFLMQGTDPASGVNGLAIQADAHGYTLFVGGSQNAGMPNTFGLFDTTAGLFRLVVNPSGNVGIGTTSPTARLQVAGVASTVTLLVQPADDTDAVRVPPTADGQTSAAFGVTNAAGSALTGAILKNGAGQFSASLQLARTDTGATYTKLLVDSNDLHLTSSATSNGLSTGTRGTIALQTNPFGDAIVQLGSAPNTGALLVYQAGAQVLGLGRNQFTINTNDANGVNYQYLTLDGGGLHLAATNPGSHHATITLNTNVCGDALLNVGTGPGTGALIVQQAGQQVLGVGRAQFGVSTVDANGVDYVYLNLDGNGLHLAATNPGFHGSVISLNTNTFGDAILSVGTGPGVGDFIVQQSGVQLMSIGGGGNLALAGRTVANGNGCLYA